MVSGAHAKPSRPKEKIGVCHIASGDRWAGAEAQLAFLLKALARKQEFSLSAILLNDGRLAEEVRRCGVDVRVIPEGQESFLQILSEATTFIQRRGVLILHSHRYKENLLAALLAWRCHVPWVVRTQHGLPEPFTGLRHIKQSTLQLLDRLVARYVTDRVIAVSDELRQRLASTITSQKIVTIYNGIDRGPVRSPLSIPEAKKRLGIPEDCIVLGTAGRLEPVKRLDIFLSMAHHIAVRLPRSRFIIAGTGQQEPRLRELAQTLGLEDRVLFLGHRNDIYDVLRAFDVFVLCSDHEGLPMVLLETLCLRLPVVARRVGGAAEVIQDGVTGVLVESADSSALAEACLDLLVDGVKRKRLSSAGTDWIEAKFNIDRAAAEVSRLYAGLCEVR